MTIDQLTNQLRDACKHRNDPTGVARLNVLEVNISDRFWDVFHSKPQIVRANLSTLQWAYAQNIQHMTCPDFEIVLDDVSTGFYPFSYNDQTPQLGLLCGDLITYFCEQLAKYPASLILADGPRIGLKFRETGGEFWMMSSYMIIRSKKCANTERGFVGGALLDAMARAEYMGSRPTRVPVICGGDATEA